VTVDLVADHPLAWYPREGADSKSCAVDGESDFCSFTESL